MYHSDPDCLSGVEGFLIQFPKQGFRQILGEEILLFGQHKKFLMKFLFFKFYPSVPFSFITESNSLQGHPIFTSNGVMINLRVVIRVRETRLNWFWETWRLPLTRQTQTERFVLPASMVSCQPTQNVRIYPTYFFYQHSVSSETGISYRLIQSLSWYNARPPHAGLESLTQRLNQGNTPCLREERKYVSDNSILSEIKISFKEERNKWFSQVIKVIEPD